MKNSIKNFETKNQTSFANFQNSALTRTEKEHVKGGEDGVVLEDIIVF